MSEVWSITLAIILFLAKCDDRYLLDFLPKIPATLKLVKKVCVTVSNKIRELWMGLYDNCVRG